MGGGGGGGDHDSSTSTATKNKKSGSIRSIFMHADGLDMFLMILGMIGAIGDGIGTPLVLFITSKIMNNIGNFSGGIDSTFLHAINKVWFLLFSIFLSFLSHKEKYEKVGWLFDLDLLFLWCRMLWFCYIWLVGLLLLVF